MFAPLRHWLRWLEGTTGYRRLRTYRVRLAVQIGFALLCTALGVQFARFLHAARGGAMPLPARPPGVEGFLPISGLMGLLDWIYQGRLNAIHPAATMLVVIFVLMALLLRKAFCSWICPVGLVSETLARIGRRLFRRNFRPWRWLDTVLRSLKYVLLLFFLLAIVRMTPLALRAFIESPYNRVSDVKMYLFFADMGVTAIAVLLLLAVGSIFINGFWCRYFCPYGGLLGLVALFSPTKIRRDGDTCIDCGLCDKVCMARLPVSKKTSITSAECTGCLDCIAVCPVKPTLYVGTKKRRFSPALFAAAVLLLFLAGYAWARIAGLWHNRIGDTEYVQRVRELHEPQYGHPGASGTAESADESAARQSF